MATSNLNVHSINVYNVKFRNKTTDNQACVTLNASSLRNDFAAVSLGVEPLGETSHFV